MQNDVDVSRIRTPDGKTLRVFFHSHSDRPKFTMRFIYIDHNGDEKMDRRGVTLSPQVLPALKRALADAEHHARASGLLE